MSGEGEGGGVSKKDQLLLGNGPVFQTQPRQHWPVRASCSGWERSESNQHRVRMSTKATGEENQEQVKDVVVKKRNNYSTGCL